MKKAKKYIYPFIFSLSFFIFYFILVIIINSMDFGEGYGGLGLFLLLILLWILIVIPFYGFKYSKLICEEKRKFLFIIYNSLVVSLCYTGPFMSEGSLNIIVKIAIALFGWVAVCTYVSYLIRINTTKEPSQNDSNEAEV